MRVGERAFWSLQSQSASDVINNAALAYKGRWRETEREGEKELRELLGSASTTLVLFSLLPLQKQLADAVPTQTIDLDACAQAPVFEI